MQTADQLGFDPQKLHRAKQVLENHVQKRTTPGAVGLLLRRKGVAACWAVGKYTYDANATPVQTDTLYDLASVTKVVATTTLCMLFVHNNRLDLDAPVQKYIPTFKGDDKNCVIVRHLLTHCSGLPAHVHLYKGHKNREAILDAACQLPLTCEPGTETAYSDMGFLLLGIILETIGNNRLDHLSKQYIFDPLQMRNTLYCPDPDLKYRIPPTENGTNLRNGLVHGEVHDENAAAMGGIAPHAGLFSTAHDLAVFLQAWLGDSFLPANTVQQFITRASFVPNSTWALGWDTVSPGGSSTGHHFTEQSFGSLGFTGTSIWADPIRDLGVILLTNRVHPTRNNTQIKNLRPEFHDAISEALIS